MEVSGGGTAVRIILEKELAVDANGNSFYELGENGRQHLKHLCGFRVGGGIDQDCTKAPKQYPDYCVYVTYVTPQGPADRCGLQVDDKLLEVNGIDFTSLTHKVAVEILKKNTVLHLLVHRRSSKSTSLTSQRGHLPNSDARQRDGLVKTSPSSAPIAFDPRQNDAVMHSPQVVSNSAHPIETQASRQAARSRNQFGSHQQQANSALRLNIPQQTQPTNQSPGLQRVVNKSASQAAFNDSPVQYGFRPNESYGMVNPNLVLNRHVHAIQTPNAPTGLSPAAGSGNWTSPNNFGSSNGPKPTGPQAQAQTQTQAGATFARASSVGNLGNSGNLLQVAGRPVSYYGSQLQSDRDYY